MSRYQAVRQELAVSPKTWLVTGAAGFIGSHLIENLLLLGQKVVGLDNFSTGYRHNYDDVRERSGPKRWEKFVAISGDISDPEIARESCENVDYVLHQAALGSVPRSLADPIATNQSNVNGFVTMLWAAKEAKVKRFVYASSSSVYGDEPELPKVETRIGNCLSPYAVSKRVNELYADVFGRCYGLSCVGLRYFNVFGPRQDPEGAYAAVIPKWIAAMIQDQPIYINGDGQTSRDFCYVANVVQANILAAVGDISGGENMLLNIAVGERTTLNELFEVIKASLTLRLPCLADLKPIYRAFRAGDVAHSHADIDLARKILGYVPSHRIEEGLNDALAWYVDHLQSPVAVR